MNGVGWMGRLLVKESADTLLSDIFFVFMLTDGVPSVKQRIAPGLLESRGVGSRKGNEDAKSGFNLRAVINEIDGKIKYQPLWVELMYDMPAVA